MAQVEWLCRGYSWTKPTLRKHSKCGISATIQERIRDVNIKFTIRRRLGHNVDESAVLSIPIAGHQAP
jgi:hypothetical protein